MIEPTGLTQVIQIIGLTLVVSGHRPEAVIREGGQHQMEGEGVP